MHKKKSPDLILEKEYLNKPQKKSWWKILAIILSAILAIMLVALLILIIKSPGKLDPLRDTQGNIIPGSISEKVWLEIGGIDPGMFIRGENPDNPVILYVHGGPGTPMMQFISFMEDIGEMDTVERLEKYFTVCYWEQRGSGMTYAKNKKDLSTLNLDQMVEDTYEVTEYLKSRFGKDKIYIMGQSWGSYIGVKTVRKYPENYLAYIGAGQSVKFVESERLSYHYMLEQAKADNDDKTIERLQKFDPFADGFPLIKEEGHQLDYLILRSELIGKYGIGHMHEFPRNYTYNSGLLASMFDFKGYTLKEKIGWLLGADYSMINLYPPLVNMDLSISNPEFEIPVYILQGIYDYQTSTVIAKEYFDIIQAPKKEFIMFYNSAHSPNLEESTDFVKVFRRIAEENPE